MKFKIRYTAGNPPIEHEQTHDFLEAPTFIEIDIPKMEIRATRAERRDSGDWTSRRRTLYINPEINTPHVPTPGMVEELLAYTEFLRMAVESGYREGFRDGAGCSFCTEEEERETEDACWRDSKANEAIHPNEG